MKNNNKEYYLSLILDSLAGKEIPAELQTWLDSSEANREYFRQVKKVWDISVLSRQNPRFNTEKGYSLFIERINELQPEPEKTNRKNRLPILRKWIQLAAVLVPFIFLSYFSFQYFRHDVLNSSLSYHQLETPYGSHTSVRLNDGTKIWMNAGSILEYNDKFGDKKRSVKLSGEAYFEVVNNNNIPFTIESGEIKVEVLGTRFNIHAYDNDPEIKVSLLEGSIQMQVEQQPPIILIPDEMVIYNTVSGDISKQIVKAADDIEWTYNRLVFKNQPFEQILHTLERTFNVQIALQNESLQKKRFGGDFVKNEPIEEIIRIMSATSGFNYKIEGNHIEIY